MSHRLGSKQDGVTIFFWGGVDLPPKLAMELVRGRQQVRDAAGSTRRAPFGARTSLLPRARAWGDARGDGQGLGAMQGEMLEGLG